MGQAIKGPRWLKDDKGWSLVAPYEHLMGYVRKDDDGKWRAVAVLNDRLLTRLGHDTPLDAMKTVASLHGIGSVPMT
jgi:hypothetical protein